MTNQAMAEDDVKIPTLRIKRPHKKVRSGCATCKRARVKCDEKRPRCTRCHRKKFECSYTERPSTSPSPPELHTVDTHSPESVRSPVDEDPPNATDLRDVGGVRDTELAKHYLTHTVQTFTAGGVCEDTSDMWHILIPALALTCPIVQQGMFTLAAMCLHYDSSSDHFNAHGLDYLEAAEAHGKFFVKESRQKLQDFQNGLNMQDQDSILACSRLLCALGFVFFRTHRQNGTTLADAAAWTWLHLLRGVQTSYVAVVEAGRPIDEMLVKDLTPQSLYHQSTSGNGVGYENPCFRYIEQSWRGVFDALRSTFHRCWSFPADGACEDLGIAIDSLFEVTEQICSQQSQSLLRTVCTWAAAVPKGFVDMLVGGSPPALAVYAHWLVLVVLVEDLWWIDDMGRAGIRDVVAMCSDADRDVRSLLIWPQQILEVGRESAETVSITW